MGQFFVEKSTVRLNTEMVPVGGFETVDYKDEIEPVIKFRPDVLIHPLRILSPFQHDEKGVFLPLDQHEDVIFPL
jgi:hypothetical protein